MAVQRSEFLDPLWRRVALVAFCFVWCAWELWAGEGFWAVIAGGMGVYGAWMYLYEYDSTPPAPPAENADAGNGEEKP